MSLRRFCIALLLATSACGSGGGPGGGSGTSSIGGTISGAVQGGVTVTLGGAASATTRTDASGSYSFTGLAAGSYTLTPGLEGYSFTPPARSIAVAGANLSSEDFTSAPAPASSFTLSGNVSGPARSGVTVALGGAGGAVTTTDAAGNYSFPGLGQGSYTVTPSQAGGYRFSPPSLSVPVTDADVGGLDFAESGAYAISGVVTSSGAPLPGVLLSLNGTATATTGATGSYSFGSLPDGTYSVAPSLAGYSFLPVSSSVTVAGANVAGSDFAATPDATPTFVLSGSVSGAVKQGVTLSLSGPESGSTVTDSNGSFSFPSIPNGTYSLTPSLAGGYLFSPPSRSVTVSGANVGGQSFTDAGAYTLSGTVTRSGSGLAGVTVTLNGATATTTDSSGNYSFPGLPNGTYGVVPSLAGYSFTPVSLSVSVAGQASAGNDFAATPSAGSTYTLSGSVSGAVAQGVQVTLGGAASATATTDSSGNYSFPGLANGSYTVTPSLAGYVFTPGSASVTVNGANVGGLSFTDSLVTYAISGTVSGAVAQGVTVTLGGAGSGSAVTDASGSYSFPGLANGSYTVTPSLAGYAFAPASLSPVVAGASVAGENFTATAIALTYSISGSVSGTESAGVTVTLTGTASAATSTDASGSYSFPGLSNGSYTVTPSLAGYVFTPGSASVTVSGANVPGQDFTDGASVSLNPFGPPLAGVIQGWSIGNTLVLKDNQGQDLFGLFWDGTGWELVHSSDQGSSWNSLASSGPFGDPTVAGESWGIQEVTQDSAGNVHVLSYGNGSGWHYARVALTRTAASISGYGAVVQGVALPGSFNSPTDYRGHILDVVDASGNERIAILVHDLGSASVTATHLQVTSVTAGITPSSAADFVTIAGTAVSGANDVVYGLGVGSGNAVHNYTSLMGQDGASRDLWVFVGGINTGDDPNLSQIKPLWLEASGTTWTADTSLAPFGNSSSGSALALEDCRGTASGVWLLYQDCADGLSLDKFAGGVRTGNVVPHPDTTANAWATANLAVSPDEKEVFVGYNLLTGAYTNTLAYWNGSGWTRKPVTPNLGDAWGSFGSAGWANGLVWGWIDGSTNAIRLSSLSAP